MTRTRAAEVTNAKGPFRIVEREIAEPGPGQVRIRVQASGICHSDSLTKEGLWPGIQYPRVPGHEVVVLATATSAKAMEAALGGLGIDGRLVVLGAAFEPLAVPPLLLLSGRRCVAGWPSGSSIDSQDTMAFCAQVGVRSMNELFPLERAAEAYERMMSGKARFRVVLTTGA